MDVCIYIDPAMTVLGGLIGGNIASYYMTKHALNRHITLGREEAQEYVEMQKRTNCGIWRFFDVGAGLARERFKNRLQAGEFDEYPMNAWTPYAYANRNKKT